MKRKPKQQRVFDNCVEALSNKIIQTIEKMPPKKWQSFLDKILEVREPYQDDPEMWNFFTEIHNWVEQLIEKETANEKQK
jgi:hypothetical protein